MNNKISRLIYYIPFYGRLRLVKRLERIEKRLRQFELNSPNDLTYQYYEARIDSIYEAIMQKIGQSEAIYFSASERLSNPKYPKGKAGSIHKDDDAV